jgi:SAM-dependent methyltransferase
LESQGLQAYEALAPIYEQHWGAAFLDDAIRLHNQFLASHLKEDAHVLDLCCGAGHFSAWLRTHGLRATGVDASRTLIALARQRVPHGEFCVADMRNFRVPSMFDAAVCFYNSVNQVLTPGGLAETFASVRRHLRPGGWFLFDIVLEEGYARSWHADEVIRLQAQTCELAYRYDHQVRLATCRVTMRSAAGDLAPAIWEFCQRPHSPSLVMEQLHHSGFQFVQQYPVAAGNPPGSRVAIVSQLGVSAMP